MTHIYGANGCQATDGVPDMTVLSNIDEAAVNQNLQVRYNHDRIYTYSGTILVAVNPYKELDIYGNEAVRLYRNKKLSEEEPHVFAVAESALRALQTAGKNETQNQSCVISGESGAGKTESTKFILQYLCSVTSGVSTWVEQQILEANTILEAFGNAKTIRNNNSSRFGKFMQVCFDNSWHIKGCVMQDYLLEQSRITFQGPHERNYHVFYQLVAGAMNNKELADQFKIKKHSTYTYLKQSGCSEIEGMDDTSKFDALRLAFNVLHVPQDICDGIYSTISAILWMGNLNFSDVDGEQCELSESDKEIVHTVATLLCLPEDGLRDTLLRRQINIRGTVTHIPFKYAEARENRHAMAKTLYSRTFAWLVDHINKCTNPGQDQTRFLGVLDIFGFENFAVNSFEQLCINYTNEKLHKFFNHYVFALEQEIYEQEGLKFRHIQFTDNSVCLELLEKPPRCILKLIAEECRMPKGSDKSYLMKLHQEFDGHENYIKGEDRRKWEVQFGICHYAGVVIYSVDGFVEKNKDTQQDVFFELLAQSENDFVGDLTRFQDLLGCTIARMGSVNNTVSRGTSKGKPTVSDAFRHQLQALVDVLQASQPWYVRCIKPNKSKDANCYDESLVLDQLRYLGMNDIIRIRREGFPIHMTFEAFKLRYYCLHRKRYIKEVREHVKAIMGELRGISHKDWQMGKTKLFLRQRVYEPLEDLRSSKVNKATRDIQTWYRCHKHRRQFQRYRVAALVIQRQYVSWKMRLMFIKRRRAAIVIQSWVRGMFAREVASALREMRRLEEQQRRRERMEEEKRVRLEEATKQSQMEEAQKQLEEELATLSNIAGRVNHQMALNNNKNNDNDATLNNNNNNSSGDGSSVDLDNLFSFLTEIPTEKNFLDDINQEMSLLADDVQGELDALDKGDKSNKRKSTSTVCSTDSLPPPPPPVSANSSAPPQNAAGLPPPPPSVLHYKDDGSGGGLPPPPPPSVFGPPSQQDRNSRQLLEDELPPPPPIAQGEEEPPKEPIYETIPAGLPGAAKKRLEHHNYVSGPPPQGPPPAPPSDATYPSPPPSSTTSNDTGATVPGSTPTTATSPSAAVLSDDGSEGVGSSSSTAGGGAGRRSRRSSGQKKLSSRSSSTHNSPSRGGGSSHPVTPTSPAGQKVCGNGAGRVDGTATLERKERRKQRVERKLHELEEMEENKENEPTDTFEMVDFAEKYFNNHERSPEGTIMSTLTRKRSSSASSIEYLPKQQLVSYSRASIIPTSHLHLYDPENITIACTIFRDLCRYCRGDMKGDQEVGTIQTIINHGLEREELRNEIYVQCIRQTTNNPSAESLERMWLLLCLCVVAFQPGKVLHKYFVSFLNKNLELDGKLSQYVQWCLENCKNTKVTCRRRPPSSVEIAAMKKLGTIVCRFFFLDGRTKAIDVHPRDTASDALQKLAERLGLASVDGWAIYQSSADKEKHVKSHEYLYDIISSWETKSNKHAANNNNSQASSAGENRFVFRKRLFRNPREIPSDPVQVNLLYSQAVYCVVRGDEFPINEKVALQLAGLQAQVALGDPQDGKHQFYTDLTAYLPDRIAENRKIADWVPLLAEAHRQCGTGKTEIVAKVWYLTCVMQFPLYGTTLFPVAYRGYWNYGNSLILGINCDGIAMIKPDDKFILYEYRYTDIESIFLHPSDDFITINLLRTLPDAHKCFVFETKEKDEIGFLIASYSPILAAWIKDIDSNKKVKQVTAEDRIRLAHNLLHVRRLLIDNNLLLKPAEQSGNIIVSTLRRLNKHKGERGRQEYGEQCENYKGFHYSFWCFSKTVLLQPLTKVADPETEQQVLQISLAILTYAGLNATAEGVKAAQVDEHQLGLVQGLLEQSMKKDALLNETYMQLIKQTTDHPDRNSRVNLRQWALLTLYCSVIPPTDKLIRKYLRAHLQRCGMDCVSEEGKYSRYAEKCLLKALNNRRRQWPPSKQEILCTINRRPIYARFHFMDGQFHSLEFDASATSREVVELIKRKIGLSDTIKGYAIYEMLGSTERCVGAEEVLADVMSRWERYRQATQQNASHHHIFLFKKHLLFESWLQLDEPVEKELIYFQVLYTLRADKFPVTQMEAVMLCALRAQIELGNFSGVSTDYGEVIGHTLSPRLLTVVTHDAVSMHHQSLFNMDPLEAKQAFLNLIKSWPLYRATIFDVTQSFTSNWSKVLWLAVDETGVHLLEHRSRNVLCTYEYDYILNYSASITSLMIITGSTRKQSKIILNTTQAFMIATLIKDYAEVYRETIAAESTATATVNINDVIPPPPPPHQVDLQQQQILQQPQQLQQQKIQQEQQQQKMQQQQQQVKVAQQQQQQQPQQQQQAPATPQLRLMQQSQPQQHQQIRRSKPPSILPKQPPHITQNAHQ